MSEQTDNFSIGRRVNNISENMLSYLEERFEAETDYTPQLCNRGLRWNLNLHVPIVSEREFSKLREWLGDEKYFSRIGLIRKGFKQLIPTQAPEIGVPTAPSKIIRVSTRAGRKALMFARSPEVVAERQFARVLISSYFGMDVDKSWIWQKDHNANGANLAYADGREAKSVLEQMAVIIDQGSTPLPSTTRYGRLAIL